MTAPNRVAIALSGLFLGVGSAAAFEAFCVWLAWRESLQSVGHNIVFWSWAIAAAGSAFITWRFTLGVDEVWRRAALAVTSGFGAWGAGGLAYAVSMASLMYTNPIVAEGLVPGYFLAGLAVAWFSFRVSRKHRVGPTV